MATTVEDRLICKQCNAPLDPLSAVDGVIECEYCHNKYTVSVDASDEVRELLRIGNASLDACKFDDAYTAFLKASEADGKQSEAYFGMALAEHKVQYLKDYRIKKDGERYRLQPICHEVSEKKFADNENYIKAVRLATPSQLIEYRQKAGEIDYIRNEFFKLKKTGLDYDCFICVKVTDDKTGERTRDYKDADDIYFALKGKGYKPFFSERELGDFTGADYETRILYALYMSECMLVVCSREEYLDTPWVKNEYTRFIGMINDEHKESDSIAVVFRGQPIERLSGKAGKLQGVNLSALDAMDRITGFVDTYFAENGKPAEIVRRDYGKTRAVRRTVQRTGVVKRELKIADASEVTASDKSKLAVAHDFLNRHEYKQAKSWCERLIGENPSLAQAYWLHFLAENECATEDELLQINRLSSGFEYLEKTISATADRSERQKIYGYLVTRVKNRYDIKCYTEYIQLPESDDKIIEQLTDFLFEFIKKQSNSAGRRAIFDEIIKTVKDTDKFVRMNLEFAHFVGESAGLEYYTNILDVDCSHAEALYMVFADAHKKIFEFCAEQANWQAVTDELYAYGFNEYATQKLFELCEQNVQNHTDMSLVLFDNLLPMIPKTQNKLFSEYLHKIIDKLFEIGQMPRAKKYNDLCLSLDKFDHEAYFNRLIINKGFTNPLAVVTVIDALAEENDFYLALTSYSEKFPQKNNFYLDISAELRKLADYLGDRASKAVRLVYVPCSELVGCFQTVRRAMCREGERLLDEIVVSYGCKCASDLYELRKDISDDERLKAALDYARGSHDLEFSITQIINTQGDAAAANIRDDEANRKKQAKEKTVAFVKKILINIPGIVLIAIGVFLVFNRPFELLHKSMGFIALLIVPCLTALAMILSSIGYWKKKYNASVLLSGAMIFIGLFVLSFLYDIL